MKFLKKSWFFAIFEGVLGWKIGILAKVKLKVKFNELIGV